MIVYLVQQREDYHGSHLYGVYATLKSALRDARQRAVDSPLYGDENAETAEWLHPRDDQWVLATDRHREGRDLTWHVRRVAVVD